jgi:hypothetical protein
MSLNSVAAPITGCWLSATSDDRLRILAFGGLMVSSIRLSYSRSDSRLVAVSPTSSVSHIFSRHVTVGSSVTSRTPGGGRHGPDGAGRHLAYPQGGSG